HVRNQHYFLNGNRYDSEALIEVSDSEAFKVTQKDEFPAFSYKTVDAKIVPLTIQGNYSKEFT
ncbi:hypothetical protein NPIL_471431, partial [Nephila pilipes]